MTNPNPVSSLFDYLDKAVDALETHLNTEIRPSAQKEPCNTTGGSWDSCDKEEHNTAEASIDEDVEILNPFIEAQRVLGKVEEVAKDLDDLDEAHLLLEVAKVHTEIGKQLLDDFER